MNNRPPSTRAEITIAAFTLFILITYLTSNYFLWKQSNIGKQAADAATSAAKTAETGLNDSRKSGNDTLTEMQKQSKAMLDAANAASDQVKLSRDTLDATIAQNRLEQRAWIGVTGIGGTIEPDKSTIIRVDVLNTGKTPAFDVHTAYATGIGPPLSTNPGPPTGGFIYTEPVNASSGIFVPNDPVIINLQNPPVFTRAELRDILADKKSLMVAGTIWYMDAFHTKRATLVCGFLDPSSLEGNVWKFVSCPFHQSAD